MLKCCCAHGGESRNRIGCQRWGFWFAHLREAKLTNERCESSVSANRTTNVFTYNINLRIANALPMMNGPVPLFNPFGDVIVPPTNYSAAAMSNLQHLLSGNSPFHQMTLPDMPAYASMLPYACSQELISQISQPWGSQTEFRSDIPSSLVSPAINLPQESKWLLSCNRVLK